MRVGLVEDDLAAGMECIAYKTRMVLVNEDIQFSEWYINSEELSIWLLFLFTIIKLTFFNGIKISFFLSSEELMLSLRDTLKSVKDIPHILKVPYCHFLCIVFFLICCNVFLTKERFIRLFLLVQMRSGLKIIALS